MDINQIYQIAQGCCFSIGFFAGIIATFLFAIYLFRR